jgi:hypothetical protein
MSAARCLFPYRFCSLWNGYPHWMLWRMTNIWILMGILSAPHVIAFVRVRREDIPALAKALGGRVESGPSSRLVPELAVEDHSQEGRVAPSGGRERSERS